MNAHSPCSAFLPALRHRLLTAPLTFLLLASTTRTSVNAAPAPSSCGTVSANCQPNKDCTPPACNVLAQFKTTDEAVCCAACTNRTTCAVWTLHHGGNGNCFLRTAATPPTEGPCTTGVLPKPPPTPPLPPGSKNVLLFAVDDLRPELACYGSLDVHTPHIDALASTSMLFERAYTMVSICAPARQAILTGRRPDTTHNWEINGAEYWRNTLPNAWSLPQFFKEAGYLTIGQGKVFHPGASSGSDDQLYSWSPEGLPYFHAKDAKHEASQVKQECGDGSDGPPRPCGGDAGFGWQSVAASRDQFQDGLITNHALAWLDTIGNRTQQWAEAEDSATTEKPPPFFLAIGLHKPHMPEVCGSKFYDLYPLNDTYPELAVNKFAPVDAPQVAIQTSSQFRSWINSTASASACAKAAPKGTATFATWNSSQCVVPDVEARAMKRAYWACISQTDSLIGAVMDRVESNAILSKETIVVFWGDHGWHLGELNQWAKYTNFEIGTRIPLLIRLAGQTTAMRSSALIESVDIFPTIVAAAGFPPPPLCANATDPTPLCVEGISALPLWGNNIQEQEGAPLSPRTIAWKSAAFSQYPRPDNGLTVVSDAPPFNASEKGEAVMGYSIRTDTWRYTEWLAFDHVNAVADWKRGPLWGIELYDHRGETSRVPTAADWNYENVNVAHDAANTKIVATLAQQLRAGWRAAMPPASSRVPMY